MNRTIAKIVGIFDLYLKRNLPKVDNPSTIDSIISNAVDPSAEKLSRPCMNDEYMQYTH